MIYVHIFFDSQIRAHDFLYAHEYFSYPLTLDKLSILMGNRHSRSQNIFLYFRMKRYLSAIASWENNLSNTIWS